MGAGPLRSPPYMPSARAFAASARPTTRPPRPRSRPPSAVRRPRVCPPPGRDGSANTGPPRPPCPPIPRPARRGSRRRRRLEVVLKSNCVEFVSFGAQVSRTRSTSAWRRSTEPLGRLRRNHCNEAEPRSRRARRPIATADELDVATFYSSAAARNCPQTPSIGILTNPRRFFFVRGSQSL